MASNAKEKETDVLYDKIALKQELHLIPLREDLADWLNKTLNVEDITAQNFMEKLDNGVIICKLARLIERKAQECREKGIASKDVPCVRFRCWENAKSESFYARDNTECFLKWCRKFGVNEAVIFESDGLVLHTQPRTVVLCLLEIGRLASKYNIEPPGLIQLEKEIYEQERKRASQLICSSRSSMVRSRTESALYVNPVKLSNGTTHEIKSNANDMSHFKSISCNKLSELDKKVMKIAKNAGQDHHAHIKRISEGKYIIGGRQVFIRLLKGRHVMVRVGGGWDTLQHFLSRHEPCEVIVVNRKSSLSDEYISLNSKESPNSFLQIKSKYKSLVSPSSTEKKITRTANSRA